jgi:hypothetical protein
VTAAAASSAWALGTTSLNAGSDPGSAPSPFGADELQGRAIATVNAFGYGALGAGSLMGGLLGPWTGLVPTILVGGVL